MRNVLFRRARAFAIAALATAGAAALGSEEVVRPEPGAAAACTVIDLTGDWEFAVENSASTWLPARVPGCVHTDLQAAGLIPDPFAGRNEERVQTIEDMNWVYRKRFTVPPDVARRSRVDLIADGLDTIARLELNGEPIGFADNMHRRWVLPVGQALREGTNELRITFLGPVKYLHSLPGWRIGDLPATNDSVGGSPFLRKAGYHFGWDWGPRLVTCGVWRPIRILATDQPLIDDVLTRQRHIRLPGSAERAVNLEVTVEVNSPVETRGRLRCSVAGAQAERDVAIPAGLSRHWLFCRVQNPDLWWPAGQGRPALYTLETELRPAEGSIDRRQTRIGFRTVSLETAPDAIGVSFALSVNDRPVFAKGANWIPLDSFPSRVDRARYRDRLQAAASCNMNMVRVWGGGVYEDDAFYELCDELGLMVWQDFMFSCSLYPADPAFCDNVRREAEDNVKRLLNHPSLALYCGNNECETALREWYKLEFTEWANYERIFHDLLPGVCARLDPDRPYWPASPHSVRALSPGETTDGDSHVWAVWHQAKPLRYYETITARFVSEFGFQSMPAIETVLAYADPSRLNLTSADVEFHQKNAGGNQRMLSQMMDLFPMPTGFENFVVLSQIQQALAMKIAVEHWRRQKPVCMGTLYWQLVDCWPVTSWSSIDYFGRWKALQYVARRFYAPLLVSVAEGIAPADGAAATASVYVTSDLEAPSPVDVEWALRTYAGETLASGATNVMVFPDAAKRVFEVDAGAYVVSWSETDAANLHTPQDVYLAIRATDGTVESRNVHHFAPYKHLNLLRPDLQTETRKTGEGMDVTVRTDVFAKWVWIEARGAGGDGRFSDNFFDLEPGESRTVLYTGPAPESFTARSLLDL